MINTFDMPIFISRSGSVLQMVIPPTLEVRSTEKTALLSPTPALLSVVLDSLYLTARSKTARQLLLFPVRKVALSMAQQTHGQTTFLRLPFLANLPSCLHLP